MADKEDFNEDDYQFGELDSINNPEVVDEEMIDAEESTTQVSEPRDRTPVMRNAIIAVIVIVLLLLLYKFFASGTPKIEPVNMPVKPIAEPLKQPIPEPVQTVTVQSTIPNQEIQTLQERMNSLDTNQQSLRADVNNLGNQIATINANINALTEQVTQLNQTVEKLALTVSEQGERIEMINQRTLVVKKVAPVIRRPSVPPTMYYIQALVPGRAWIISTNGSTLTVREGNKIPGYGVVKFVDSLQGRIITSSGKVITFSQDDS